MEKLDQRKRAPDFDICVYISTLSHFRLYGMTFPDLNPKSLHKLSEELESGDASFCNKL
jgi:hypothetical protein